MPKRMSHEDFVDLVLKRNPKVKILGKYINARTTVKVKCLCCEKEWDADPTRISRFDRNDNPDSNGCPDSKKHSILTHEDFVKNVSDNVELIDKFSGWHKKMKCKCKICDSVYYTTSECLYQGCIHNICAKEKQRKSLIKSTEDFINEVNAIRDDIDVVGEYVGFTKHVKVKCRKCGHSWEVQARKILQNASSCGECKRQELGVIYYNELIVKLGHTDFEILDTCCNSQDKIKCRCNKCNSIFFSKAHHLRRGQACPKCSESKGEKAITLILRNEHINFISQHKYDSLRGINGGLLSYDFYLPDYNLLIEYQGNFHDGTADIQTEEGYLMQQEHDKRKRCFAKDNNIELLEIWYWDYDHIESILSQKLNINNTMKSA